MTVYRGYYCYIESILPPCIIYAALNKEGKIFRDLDFEGLHKKIDKEEGEEDSDKI